MYGYLTNAIRANLTRNMRRCRRWAGFVAVVLLAAGWGGLWLTAQRRHQPPHAKQKYRTVYDRAAEICSTLGSSCEMDPRPIFSERLKKCYAGDHAPLRMWKFYCQVDSRPTWLIFNDETVGLCYLLTERSQQRTTDKARPRALDTQSEAAEAGFQRLKGLKLAGRGTEVALRELPHLNWLRNAWLITWAVKANADAQPYAVRMEIDRDTGMPMSVVDTAFQDGTPHL